MDQFSVPVQGLLKKTPISGATPAINPMFHTQQTDNQNYLRMAISFLELSSPPPPPPYAAAVAASEPTVSSSDDHGQQIDPTTLLPLNQLPNPSFSDDIDQKSSSSEEEEIPNSSSFKKSKHYKFLLAINYACLFIGSVSSSLITKYYFVHKGSSRWVSTWIQSAGFPILLLPVYLPYYILNSTRRKPFTGFTPRILLLSMAIGVFLGVNNLLISWGTSYLPVSTSSLLLSSQLAFNLILSAIMVKQKITFNNLNCVVLLTLSSVLLALISNHDRPQGLTRGEYLIGFFSTLGAGLMFALYLPLMEMIYRRVYCYAMVVEMQLVMEVFATVFATVGMAADGGFREIKSEGWRVFDKGPVLYWWTIGGSMMTWQLCFLGTAGMVFLTTSLTGGICTTALLGMNVIGGVVVFGDNFGSVKVVATVICVWGFCSYLYGMHVGTRKQKGVVMTGVEPSIP